MATGVTQILFLASDSFVVSLLTKATLVLVLALAAASFARQARASVRHAILAAALGVLLILPLARLLLPAVSVPVSISQANSADTSSIGSAADSDAFPLSTGESAIAEPRSLRQSSMSVVTVLVMAWASGAALLLVLFAAALRQVRHIGRTGAPWPDVSALVSRLAFDAGIRRRVHVIVHKQVVAPMTCGFRRPTIVLPEDAVSWPHRDVEHAIIHELEHIYRADWLYLLLSRIVCALYWVHPLVWIVSRRVVLEAERACDDAVLRDGDGTGYADQLVALARRLMKHDPRPVLSMANRSDLSARIAAVLDRGQRRGRPSLLVVATIVSALAVVMLTIAPLAVAERVVGAQMAQPAAAASPAFELASVNQNKTEEFDVVSIKPNESNDRVARMGNQSGGRFLATNVPLQALIQFAYQVQDFQIIGGEQWITTARFDVEGTSNENVSLEIRPAGLPPGPMQVMLRAVLADRFGLRQHFEKRELPIYSLVILRKDGRLGDMLHPSSFDCAAMFAAAQREAGSRVPPAPQARPVCNMRVTPSSIAAGATSLNRLASFISQSVRRVVNNDTGLTGLFDFDLRWTPEETPGDSTGAGQREGVSGTSEPAIFTALQEQLGLKLESQRANVDVLVIDSANRPTPN